MKPTLRVLLVEDSEIDAQLILRQISVAGYSLETTRVDNEEDYRKALAEGNWDLLVCDYQLPQFDAPSALALLKQSGLDLPFIVVSGSISTDLAVEMMRRGANDYLLKGDMARFLPAIERELREAARRREYRAAEQARHRAEEAQRISDERYREIYNTTTDLVVCTDIAEDGTPRFSHCNATSERILGLSHERDSGKPFDNSLLPSLSPSFLECLKACRESGLPQSADETLTLLIGVLHVHVTMHPVADPKGGLRRIIIVLRDITERKRGEEALRKAHAELERRVKERTAELTAANARLRELDRLKSEFLATMSHELRTPLNSIIGFTSLVKEEITGPLNDEQRKQLGMVYSASKHLLGLINDLLDVSRIEAGRFRLEHEAFDFSGVVAETVAQIKPLAQAKRLTLRPQLPLGALPMFGDRRRCLQVLLNLTHNAIKFTEKGSVDIVVRTEGNLLRVDVIDTGIGIKPEQMAQLFEAFRQLDGSAKRSYEGTGLGLYLCRKLLNLMGGDIEAHSAHGQGTRISFSVPRRLKSDSNPPFTSVAASSHESQHPTR